ncbi:type II secretion system F family protein [Sinirhodobacter populi]|uniref:Type II secretion system F family protein n=1 Tax=Paenirhodobacter populi TaxID=2306993 RepID=A0A443K8G9_9RHOB|nr:type II secretion system F family protein [Sinirhodobacter populi]RWR29012.1 type II secretion system F family protein [Sinirhodobacter populi]
MRMPILSPMALIFVLASAGVALAGMALFLLLRPKRDPLDRLKPRKTAAQPERKKTLRQQAGSDRLDRYAGFLEPKNKEEMSKTREWLHRAGYRSPSAVRNFHATQFIGGIGCLLLGLGFIALRNTSDDAPPSEIVTILAVLLPGLLGYYAPRRWVEGRVAARTQEIQDSFPDALDMLLVCVEAGQSLDQGILRVSREMRDSGPVLAEELDTVANEIKAGLDKAVVLRAFGSRTGVPDVMSFVTVMIQSQQFGTSIAEALRLYSADMRDKRVMRAEEAANKIPTKMTLGTMLFTVPPLLIILIGPSVHGMMESFAQMGGP